MRSRSRVFFRLAIVVLAAAGCRLLDAAEATGPAQKSFGSRFTITAEERAKIEQAIPAKAPAAPARPRKLLIFDLNVGYGGHRSIAHANLAFALMGKKTGVFETVTSDDPAVFRPESLRQFDAVFLNNTVGNLFEDPALRKSLVEFVSGGGGLMGVHGTTVAFTRWPGAHEDWPEFGLMLGGRGAAHRASDERVFVKLDDPGHPLLAAFAGQGFERCDEFFRVHGPYSRDRVRVLLSIDTQKTDLDQGQPGRPRERADNDYALAWVRSYGRGRVFYSTIAHNPNVFWDARMLQFYLAAAQFALGDLPAPTAPSGLAARSDIPRLDWQPRSDWINVKTGVKPGAVGDGRVDDTAAIQAALDRPGEGKTVYLPPGTYRITQTLVFRGPAIGNLVVGHGRDTRLVWDGPEGGRMFWSNGIAYSRYVGLSWDGRGKAAVGFEHAAEKRFETEVRHEHEAFRNFTGFGIRIGHQQKVASAELLYRNCLFENCGTALAFLTFNDYDNTIDGCEFRDCGRGVFDTKGNFYARNCHFENSRQSDFAVGSEHGSSIRRCTSIGSKRFVEELGTIAPLTIQDCHVAGWTDPEGAVHLNGSPALMFDCTFTRPPSERPPVKLVNASQKLMVSNNRPEAVERLVQVTPAAKLYVIPPGKLGGTIASAAERFLQSTARVPGKVFDAVRDFGAKGDGRTDDTAAVQAAIDAARQAGQGAIAYLPTGRYIVSKTLAVTGRDYTLGGSGFRCGLVWRGEAGRPIVEVSGVENVALANLAVGNHDLGPMNHGDDLRITSPDGKPCRLVLDEVSAFGMYQKAPDKHGIHFAALPPGSVVDAIHVQGNLRMTDSAGARLLFRTSYEGTITIEGRAGPRDGLIGFLTRLATQSKPTLRVRDNHSIVMSDFYNEQSDQHLVFEGAAGQPEGAVTIQGPKMHMFTQEPVFDIRDYAGRIYYGQSQFYNEPKEPRFVSHGTRPCRLILAGHFWYDTKPRIELGPEVKLTMLANREVPDSGVDAQALAAIASALDDLRRLGAMDRQLGE